jgi:hypothetical protein
VGAILWLLMLVNWSESCATNKRRLPLAFAASKVRCDAAEIPRSVSQGDRRLDRVSRIPRFVAPSSNQSVTDRRVYCDCSTYVDVDHYGYANCPPPLATSTIYRRLRYTKRGDNLVFVFFTDRFLIWPLLVQN